MFCNNYNDGFKDILIIVENIATMIMILFKL